jgi:hypothetical protein
MKKILFIIMMSVSFLQLHAQKMDSTWFRPRQLVNSPMPPINGTTIQGEFVDASFFKGQVVVLAFANLVNVGSLKEIEALNRLQLEFKGQPFKILSVIPNAKQDVINFNNPDSTSISFEDNDGMGHNLRLSFHLPVMEYPVIATCEQRNPDNTLHVACDNVVNDYLIGGYPVLCVIDKKGIVRYVHVGMAPKEQVEQWYQAVTRQINVLLKEL